MNACCLENMTKLDSHTINIAGTMTPSPNTKYLENKSNVMISINTIDVIESGPSVSKTNFYTSKKQQRDNDFPYS